MHRRPPSISGARFVAATGAQLASGILGWASVHIDDRLVVQVAIRRTRADRLMVVFPEHRDRFGISRSPVRPASEAARLELESAILAALAARTAP